MEDTQQQPRGPLEPGDVVNVNTTASRCAGGGEADISPQASRHGPSACALALESAPHSSLVMLMDPVHVARCQVCSPSEASLAGTILK
jgi:hypothetical protein